MPEGLNGQASLFPLLVFSKVESIMVPTVTDTFG